jgi:hypothetical protein
MKTHNRNSRDRGPGVQPCHDAPAGEPGDEVVSSLDDAEAVFAENVDSRPPARPTAKG